MKVLKFGGSSVGNAENIGKVIEIVKKAIETDSCVVVLSAMSGTTDGLINIAKTAENHDEGFRIRIKELEEKHISAAKTLLGETSQDGIFDFIENRFNELRSIWEGVFLLRELSPRTLDRVVSFGEILSTKIVSAKFTSLGVENVWVDARQLIQ
ncbi:MAG: bifunctional aspartate kinase/homoserine dehydrogenase I, partial [Acidobacteriota bacterium]